MSIKSQRIRIRRIAELAKRGNFNQSKRFGVKRTVELVNMLRFISMIHEMTICFVALSEKVSDITLQMFLKKYHQTRELYPPPPHPNDPTWTKGFPSIGPSR